MTDPTQRGQPVEDRGKRSYERPRILSREPLEVIATVCSPPGKANPGACPMGPINS